MKYIPYPHIELVLTKNAEVLEAIVATLPAKPLLVTTPKLLSVMTGDDWGEETIITHKLIKLYCATCFYIESLPKYKGEHFASVKKTLQEEQHAAYGDVDDPARFLIKYLNAYEKALIKYLHLFKVGGEVDLQPGEDGTPPLTYFILRMTPETLQELRFHELLTTEVREERTKRLDDFEHELDALQHTLADLDVK
jgi:hypothetical protein